MREGSRGDRVSGCAWRSEGNRESLVPAQRSLPPNARPPAQACPCPVNLSLWGKAGREENAEGESGEATGRGGGGRGIPGLLGRRGGAGTSLQGIIDLDVCYYQQDSRDKATEYQLDYSKNK